MKVTNIQTANCPPIMGLHDSLGLCGGEGGGCMQGFSCLFGSKWFDSIIADVVEVYQVLHRIAVLMLQGFLSYVESFLISKIYHVMFSFMTRTPLVNLPWFTCQASIAGPFTISPHTLHD